MIVYRPASKQEITDLRHAVLRAGLPRETAIFDGDDEAATVHLAAVEDGRVVGCVTIMRRPYNDRDAWQLRGMAVASHLRGTGVGAKLLAMAETHARDAAGPRLMWCNAREPAVGFYEHHGWQIASDPFDIPTAGPHRRMIRQLT